MMKSKNMEMKSYKNNWIDLKNNNKEIENQMNESITKHINETDDKPTNKQ